MFRLRYTIFALLPLFFSCKKEQGCYVESGKWQTRVLDLPPFHTINHSIEADFILHSGSEQSVVIKGDKRILDLIEKETSVENGVWDLSFTSCVHKYQPLIIEMTLPSYLGFTNKGVGNVSSPSVLATGSEFTIEVDGSGDLDLTIDYVEQLIITMNGSGNLKLNGSAANQNITLNGNGVVDCFGVSSQHTSISLNGSSNCMVNVSDSLIVDVNGPGIVYYKGYPYIVQSIQGGGSLIDSN